MLFGDILRLIRPKQWAKNLLVFAAPLFAARMGEPEAALRAVLAFAAMCLISSATYVVNDWLDRDRDRLHPEKADRPLASGRISGGVAVFLAVLLAGVGFGLAAALSMGSLKVVGVYAVLQVLYNLWLKRIPVADVFTLATGFVLRAILGATAVWVPISGWLLFCTGALALMLGFAKRRHEFILQGEERAASRSSLAGYSLQTLNALLIMTATGAAICYGIYTLDSKTAAKYPAIVITNLPVLYGICRYVLLVFSRDEGGEPSDTLFRDWHMLCSILLFVGCALLALGGFQIPLLER